jgi:hypothetical protein
MPPQQAGWPQDTVAAIRAKAFDDRLPSLEPSYDLAKGDVLSRLRKAEASLPTAPRCYKAGFAKIAHDLDQMITRDRQFLRELLRPERTLRLGGKPHKCPEPEVGE